MVRETWEHEHDIVWTKEATGRLCELRWMSGKATPRGDRTGCARIAYIR